MRLKFNEYFMKKYPGTSLDSQTARDEWESWSDGYIAGLNRSFEIFASLNVLRAAA